MQILFGIYYILNLPILFGVSIVYNLFVYKTILSSGIGTQISGQLFLVAMDSPNVNQDRNTLIKNPCEHELFGYWSCCFLHIMDGALRSGDKFIGVLEFQRSC